MGGPVDLALIPICGLATWRHRCSGGMHMHHVVSRGKLQKNDEARRFCEHKHPEIFMAAVCGVANIGRLADTDEAQAILLAGKIAAFGEEYVRSVWSDFEALWVSDFPSLDGILRHLPRDAPRPVV